jgi:cyclopropane-fatty-acyl-phospholipid synthase
MSESWLQYYARTAVFSILSRIQRGRLIVISKYRGEKEDPEVFEGKSTEGHDAEGDVVVVFNSPKVWVRMCQAFDLVRAQSEALRLEWHGRLIVAHLGIRRSIYVARG